MSAYSNFLSEFQYWLREYGAPTVMADFRRMNPELHESLKKALTNEEESDTIPVLLKRKLGD